MNRTPAEGLLDVVLADLGRHGLGHALVRDPGRDGRGQLEADLLIEPEARAQVEDLLARHGFARRPSWGRRPHRFHLRPVIGPTDTATHPQPRSGEKTGTPDWLKVDLVTDLRFGPWHELATNAAGPCLATEDRERPDRLCASDELCALLLHALVDGRGLRPAQLDRLRELAPDATTPGALARQVTSGDAGWPTWRDITDAARERDQAVLESMAPTLVGRLESQSAGSVRLRRAGNRAGRRSVKVLTALAGRGKVVALVGPDGTGKTTLATSVASSIPVPTRVLYGGTYRSGTSNSRFPGGATASVIGRLVSTRAQLSWHRARGRLVILDRHPVEARPTPGDGLGPKARVRRHVIAAILPKPNLLLVLDAPATLLNQRRPEHTVEHLDRDRIQHIALIDRVPGATIVDASATPDAVLGQTIDLIWTRVMAVPDAPVADQASLQGSSR